MAERIAPQSLEACTALAPQRFRISFEIVVIDPAQLWHTAARIAFRQPGASIADIEAVLGPADDPMCADCLTMLTAPAAIPGTLPLGFVVETVAGRRHAATRERALLTLAMRDLIAISGALTRH